jgi:hypothetical protein
MIKSLGMIAGILFSTAVYAAPVTVTFSGTVNQFNTGPFSAGTPFSGTFELDTSVTVSPINRFLGAVDNLQLDIGGNLFTGDNGNLQQVNLTAGEALLFNFPVGTTSGTYNGKAFESMSFELRGPDLFSNVSQMTSKNLTTSDFTYISATFDFGGVSDWVIVRGTEFNSVTVSAVPLPASALLLMPALLGLFGIARKKRPAA